MGRTIDVREEESSDVDEITFGEEGEYLRKSLDNVTLYVCDDLNAEKVEIAICDIDNFIKALQAAKKEWT